MVLGKVGREKLKLRVFRDGDAQFAGLATIAGVLEVDAVPLALVDFGRVAFALAIQFRRKLKVEFEPTQRGLSGIEGFFIEPCILYL